MSRLAYPPCLLLMALACSPDSVKSASGESCTKTDDCVAGLRCFELSCVSADATRQEVADAAEMVTLEIRTNAPAEIVDGVDGASYGKTNGEAIAVPRSATPLTLTLRSAGYETLEFEVIPSRDKSFDKTLVQSDGPRSPDLKSPFGEREGPPSQLRKDVRVDRKSLRDPFDKSPAVDSPEPKDPFKGSDDKQATKPEPKNPFKGDDNEQKPESKPKNPFG